MNNKIINRLGLVALAVFLGGAIGSFTAIFLRLLYKGIEFLWFELPELLSVNGEIPFYTLILCIVGGLLVGLCQRYLGDHPQPFQETLASFRENGRFDYSHIGQAMTTATLSLLFGASLGPEAALMDMVGGLSTWTGDNLKRVGLHVGVIDNEDTAWPRAWKWGLLGTAVAAGIAGFVLFIGDLFSGGLIAIDAYEMSWIDLAYALPVGLAGALGGLLYVQMQNTLPLITDRLKKWPVLRSVSGGVVFGILASIFPLVLFSGQKELQPLYDSHAEQIRLVYSAYRPGEILRDQRAAVNRLERRPHPAGHVCRSGRWPGRQHVLPRHPSGGWLRGWDGRCGGRGHAPTAICGSYATAFLSLAAAGGYLSCDARWPSHLQTFCTETGSNLFRGSSRWRLIASDTSARLLIKQRPLPFYGCHGLIRTIEIHTKANVYI